MSEDSDEILMFLLSFFMFLSKFPYPLGCPSPKETFGYGDEKTSKVLLPERDMLIRVFGSSTF